MARMTNKTIVDRVMKDGLTDANGKKELMGLQADTIIPFTL
jgi:hypothetical protein